MPLVKTGYKVLRIGMIHSIVCPRLRTFHHIYDITYQNDMTHKWHDTTHMGYHAIPVIAFMIT